MPFLPPIQQCQSTEGKITPHPSLKLLVFNTVTQCLQSDKENYSCWITVQCWMYDNEFCHSDTQNTEVIQQTADRLTWWRSLMTTHRALVHILHPSAASHALHLHRPLKLGADAATTDSQRSRGFCSKALHYTQYYTVHTYTVPPTHSSLAMMFLSKLRGKIIRTVLNTTAVHSGIHTYILLLLLPFYGSLDFSRDNPG